MIAELGLATYARLLSATTSSANLLGTLKSYATTFSGVDLKPLGKASGGGDGIDFGQWRSDPQASLKAISWTTISLGSHGLELDIEKSASTLATRSKTAASAQLSEPPRNVLLVHVPFLLRRR